VSRAALKRNRAVVGSSANHGLEFQVDGERTVEADSLPASLRHRALRDSAQRSRKCRRKGAQIHFNARTSEAAQQQWRRDQFLAGVFRLPCQRVNRATIGALTVRTAPLNHSLL